MQPRCRECDKKVVRSRTGRPALYCSDACRQYAARHWTPGRDATIERKLSGMGRLLNRHETPPKKSTKSASCRGARAGRASSVNLLGSGPRTPWAGYDLDRKLVREILDCEIGAR